MRFLITNFILLTVILTSCKKTDDLIEQGKDPNLIEEFTYDPTGIVYKIVNDVEHAWNYQENYIQKIDSICLMKFHYWDTIDPFNGNFTWFTKKGQYVCWRYKYNHDGYKYLGIGFPNPIRRHEPSYKFCMYISMIPCNEISSSFPDFIIMFPIENDTVVMRLSSIRPDKFLTYK